MKTAIKGSAAGLALLLAVGAAHDVGCGSDSGKATGDGSGGKSGTGGQTAAAAGGAMGTVACGADTICQPSGTMEACCKDSFSKLCGVKNALAQCVDAPKPPPAECPAVPAVMGFALNACCTTGGQCGVDFAGTCIDFATAAMMARARGIDAGVTLQPTPCTPM